MFSEIVRGGGGGRRRTLGLSRLCSATFEQRFGVWSNFLGSSNLEQTCISEQVSVHGNVLNVYQFFYNFSFFFNFFFLN